MSTKSAFLVYFGNEGYESHMEVDINIETMAVMSELEGTKDSHLDCIHGYLNVMALRQRFNAQRKIIGYYIQTEVEASTFAELLTMMTDNDPLIGLIKKNGTELAHCYK